MVENRVITSVWLLSPIRHILLINEVESEENGVLHWQQMVYVMLASVVLSIFLHCVIFYHAFQVKSIHIYFDQFFLRKMLGTRYGPIAGVTNMRPAKELRAAREIFKRDQQQSWTFFDLLLILFLLMNNFFRF